MFQIWDWNGNCYKLTQYIIDDEKVLEVSKFECEYRATRREEITQLLTNCGCCIEWKFPEETGFYQPIVIVKNNGCEVVAIITIQKEYLRNFKI